MTTKFVYITDPHISVQRPVNRTDPDYFGSLRAKLTESVEIANEVGAAAYLIGGDLWPSAYPAVPAIVDVMKVFSNLKCPAYAIWGNHDQSGKQMIANQRTLAGLLTRFEDWPVKMLEDHLFLGRPGVLLCPEHYRFGIEEELRSGLKLPTVPGFTQKDYAGYVKVGLAHAYISDKRIPGCIHYTEVDWPVDVVLCSHYHAAFGTKEHNGRVFVSPGALCRSTIGYDDVSRHPQVAVVTISEGRKVDVEYRPLASVRPSEEVFRLDWYQERKEAQTHREEQGERLALFLDSLTAGDVLHLDLLELLHIIARGGEVSQAAVECAEGYLRRYLVRS